MIHFERRVINYESVTLCIRLIM
uniref:Uncharacterized protein n=1 Tax=Anguilla anguilla TaxID=7936 RepID=A0A0E9V183_ANGAN